MLQPCKEGWYFADKMCYMLIEKYMSWNDSRSRCASLSSYLAAIHSERVNNATRHTFKFGWIWLGIPFMHRSAHFQLSPHPVDFLKYFKGIYFEHDICFLLCFLGQIITWQKNPYLLDYVWPCTVINDSSQLFSQALEPGVTMCLNQWGSCEHA